MFYSGSRLAPDLSLPALQRRWRDRPLPVGRGSPWVGATRSVNRARARLHRPGPGDVDGDLAGIAHSTSDVLVAVAGLAGAPAWWGEAAELVERAGRAAGRARFEYGPVSSDLRRAARSLLARGRVGGDDDAGAMIALAVALAALLVEIGRWHKTRHRPHQAAAAHSAAGLLSGHQSRAVAQNRQLDLDLVVSRARPRPGGERTIGGRPDQIRDAQTGR